MHWTARGTNSGTGNGLPATGRAVDVLRELLFRFDTQGLIPESCEVVRLGAGADRVETVHAVVDGHERTFRGHLQRS